MKMSIGLLTLLAVFIACGDSSPSTNSTSSSVGGAAGGAGAWGGGMGGDGNLSGFAGASGFAGSPENSVICDGSSEIRLATRYISPSFKFFDWHAGRWDLGSRFLFVDGQCRFWMEQLESIDPACQLLSDYRTGVIDQETAELLSKTLSYQDPPQLGPLCKGDVVDSSAFYFWNGVGEFVCPNGFKEPEGFNTLYEKLHSQSVPFEGNLRIGIAKNQITQSLPKGELSWPLERSMDDFLMSDESKHNYGGLFLVSSPDEIAKLRILRDQWCDLLRPFGYPINGLINLDRVDKSDILGTLVVYRQDLPFSDPVTGLWSPPQVE